MPVAETIRTWTMPAAIDVTAPSAYVAWRLWRDEYSARCILWGIGDRVELHIHMTHDVVMSQQCEGVGQAAAIARAWRAALLERGWADASAFIGLRPKSDRRAATAPDACQPHPPAR